MKYFIVLIAAALVAYIAYDLVRGMREKDNLEHSGEKVRHQVLLPGEEIPANVNDGSVASDENSVWAEAAKIKIDENALKTAPKTAKKHTRPEWFDTSENNANHCRKAVEDLIDAGLSADAAWCSKHIGVGKAPKFDPTDFFFCHAAVQNDFQWCERLENEESKLSCRIETIALLMAKMLLLEKADEKAFQVRLVQLGVPKIKEWSNGYHLAWRLTKGEIDDATCAKEAQTETDQFCCLFYGNSEPSDTKILRHEGMYYGIQALKTGRPELLKPLDLRKKTVFFSLLTSKNYCDDMIRHHVLSICDAPYPLPYLD